MKYDTTILITVTVEYEYHRASRGARDSCCSTSHAGPPLEPDEDEQVEIIAAYTSEGTEIKLTDDQRERIEAEILEAHQSTAYDYED